MFRKKKRLYSPCEKAAILLNMLGDENSKKVLESFNHDEIVRLYFASQDLCHISKEVEQQIVREFYSVLNYLDKTHKLT